MIENGNEILAELKRQGNNLNQMTRNSYNGLATEEEIKTCIHSIATESAFISQINFEPQVRGKDVVLISGVGDVFPFMRIHSLLEAM